MTKTKMMQEITFLSQKHFFNISDISALNAIRMV